MRILSHEYACVPLHWAPGRRMSLVIAVHKTRFAHGSVSSMQAVLRVYACVLLHSALGKQHAIIRYVHRPRLFCWQTGASATVNNV